MSPLILKIMFRGARRRQTWRKVAELLTHGIPIREVMIMLRDRALERKNPLSAIHSDILERMTNGAQFHEAVVPWIPPEEAMLIKGGYQSDQVPRALRDCADLIEAKGKIVGGFVGAMIYPCILLGLLAAFLLVLAGYVMPEISAMVDPTTWTGSAGLLYSLTQFAASPFGVGLLVLLAGSAGTVVGTLPYWTGACRLRVENLIPWSIYRLMIGSVWLYTLATLLKGGIQLADVFDGMLRSKTMRPYLKERVRIISVRNRSDSSFGHLLANLDMHFPDDELIEEMAVYARLSNFDAILYSIAKEWLDNGVQRITKMAQALNVVMMLAIIGLVGWVALAFRSLQQQMMTGMGM